ncbi:peptidase S1, partial [Myxococcus llanfairpwllgwyngyllgogerychwyrndrobwllllantysiliogogogochensis]
MNRSSVAFRRALATALLLAVPSASWAQAPAPAPAQGQPGNLQPATREAQALPSLAPLVDSVKSAVVNVDVQARGGGGGPRGMEDNPLFDRFFGGGGG